MNDASEDRHLMPLTYEAFCEALEEQIQSAEADGFPVCKIDINADNLLAWCRMCNLKVNGESRAAYYDFIISETFGRDRDI